MVHTTAISALFDDLALTHPIVLKSVPTVLVITSRLHLLLLVIVVLELILLRLQFYLRGLADDHLNITGLSE